MTSQQRQALRPGVQEELRLVSLKVDFQEHRCFFVAADKVIQQVVVSGHESESALRRQEILRDRPHYPQVSGDLLKARLICTGSAELINQNKAPLTNLRASNFQSPQNTGHALQFAISRFEGHWFIASRLAKNK